MECDVGKMEYYVRKMEYDAGKTKCDKGIIKCDVGKMEYEEAKMVFYVIKSGMRNYNNKIPSIRYRMLFTENGRPYRTNIYSVGIIEYFVRN